MNRDHEVLVALRKLFKGVRKNPSSTRASRTATSVPYASRADVIVQRQIDQSPSSGHARDLRATYGGTHYVILHQGVRIGSFKNYVSAIQRAKKHAKRTSSRLFYVDKDGSRKLVADYRD